MVSHQKTGVTFRCIQPSNPGIGVPFEELNGDLAGQYGLQLADLEK
jgi:hypothetical protein